MLFSSLPSPDSLLPVYNTLHDGISDEDVRKVLEDIYTESYISYLQLEEKDDEAFEFIYNSMPAVISRDLSKVRC